MILYRTFIITAIIMALNAYCDDIEYLPPADPKKPIYQWKGFPPPMNMWLGGKCYKVRIDHESAQKQAELEIEQAKAEMQLKEMRMGSWLMLVGIIIAACGVAFHFVTSLPALHRLSEYALVAGGCLTSGGLVFKKISEWQNWIFLGIAVLIIGFAMYKFRNWSVSHIFKKK